MPAVPWREIGDDGVEVGVGDFGRIEARHDLARPRAHRLRVADQLAQGLGRKILRRAHGLAEVGPELADTCTLHAVARHALDREHLLPAPRRRICRQAHVDRHLRPAVRGRLHSRERYRLIRPLLAPNARALRMLPHEIERTGALLLAGKIGPRRGRILHRDPGDAAAGRTLVDQRARELRHEAVGGARLDGIERRVGCGGNEGEQRHRAERHRDAVGDVSGNGDRRRVGAREQLSRRVNLRLIAERNSQRRRVGAGRSGPDKTAREREHSDGKTHLSPPCRSTQRPRAFVAPPRDCYPASLQVRARHSYPCPATAPNRNRS